MVQFTYKNLEQENFALSSYLGENPLSILFIALHNAAHENNHLAVHSVKFIITNRHTTSHFPRLFLSFQNIFENMTNQKRTKIRRTKLRLNNTNVLHQHISQDISTTVFEIMWKIILRGTPFKEESFQNALTSMRNAYSDSNQCTKLSTNVNYARPIFRRAYLYAYGISHSNMIFREWEHYAIHIPILLRLNKTLCACCVGGGPAIDAMGLHLFLNNNFFMTDHLEVTVLDK